MKYFIGNWKMFGVSKSANIIKKIIDYVKKDKKKSNYKVVIAPPYTLLQNFSKNFNSKFLSISAQNCHFKDNFSSNTGSISAYMIKELGVQYLILGHSDNRSEGDDEKKLSLKVNNALNNKMKVIFCIGENKKQKKLKKTNLILKKQLSKVLKFKMKSDNIIVAYEPIWSIGTGLIPKEVELKNTTVFIKKTLKKIFKSKKTPHVLYGGSVDGGNIKELRRIKEIDGFLIGGASKSYKKFIDIIRNYYRY